jgi:hypothetical protein
VTGRLHLDIDSLEGFSHVVDNIEIRIGGVVQPLKRDATTAPSANRETDFLVLAIQAGGPGAGKSAPLGELLGDV